MLKRNNIGSLYGLRSTVIYISQKMTAVDLAMLSDGKYVTTGMDVMMQALYLGRRADIRCMITVSCYNCL